MIKLVNGANICGWIIRVKENKKMFEMGFWMILGWGVIGGGGIGKKCLNYDLNDFGMGYDLGFGED